MSALASRRSKDVAGGRVVCKANEEVDGEYQAVTFDPHVVLQNSFTTSHTSYKTG